MTAPKYLNAGSSGEWGWHATEVALRCPQLYAYHYRCEGADLDGDRGALIRGSLVHQGLAHHYARLQSAQLFQDPEEWLNPVSAIQRCAEELEANGEKSKAGHYVESATNIVLDYLEQYREESLEVVAVEEVFTAEIAGRKFTQRLDLVGRRSDGKIYVFDHKTTGFYSAKIPERYTLSGQFLGMHNFGQQVYGKEFGGVIINVLACGAANKPTARGETTFTRVPPNPAPNAQRLFTISVQHARERIEELDRSGLNPWRWPKVLSEQVCVTAYGKCEGFDLCRWGEP